MRKSIFILLFALLGVLSAQAYDFKVDGIYYDCRYNDEWEIIDGEVEVTSGSYSGSIIIPATVTYNGKTYAVTSIGVRAFDHCSGLTSVTIDEGVTTIGAYAFVGCSGLTSVTLPESVTDIEEFAFYRCTSISSPLYTRNVFAYMPETYSGEYAIPSGIQSIAGGAFVGCSGLTSVTIPESVTSIGYAAFSGTSISSPLYNSKVFAYLPQDYSGEYMIQAGIQSIAGGALAGCSSLTSVTIPESVTSIGDEAFYGCTGLTSVTIPEGVTSIGLAAFRDCTGLRSVEWNAVDYHNPYSWEGGLPFRDCKNITDIIFGNQVERIPAYLCYGMDKLTSVTIPNSVTSIGESAFFCCFGLKSVTIPESVTYIGGGAFKGCEGLTSVTIPKSVDTIRGSTFDGCSGLKSVTIPESVTSIEEWAFGDCHGLTSVTIPNSVTSIGDYAFVVCSGLTSVTIPESVTSIGSSAFEDCSGLTSVEWNAIDCQDFSYNTLFSNCKDITSMAFGSQVEHIPSNLCYGLSGLTSVTIPESVTYIGDYAFYGCSGLTAVQWNAVACQDFSSDNPPFPNGENITSVTFGKQVERIPAFLCYGLNGLTAITLPGSVDTVGKGAFKECNYLLSVTSLSKIPPYCFYDEENSVFSVYGTLFVPKGSKRAYQTAQEWYKFSRIEETETTYTVTVQPNDAAMGRVTGGGEYQEGEQAILAAIPNQGYYFVRWDDGSTNNPRIMTVNEDITLTAIFAKNGDNPTANENAAADNFRVYVQNRTIHLSEDRGSVQVYNMAGQCVYNGHATAIPVQHAGVYVLRVADGRSRKIIVR